MLRVIMKYNRLTILYYILIAYILGKCIMNRYKKSIIFHPSTYTGNQKYFYIHKPALPVTAVKCIFFRKHKLTYKKPMSSKASSPASPASITEEISTRTMSDVVKDFNTEELIEYLKKKNLKLEESHFKFF